MESQILDSAWCATALTQRTWDYLPIDTQRIILYNLYIDDDRQETCKYRLVSSQFRDELENVQMPNKKRHIKSYDKMIELQIIGMKDEDALLSTLKWLKQKGQLPRVMPCIMYIARRGFLRAVRWLHNHGVGGFGPQVMDEAARAGRLDVIKWLHENIKGKEGEVCTRSAMANAAHLGHLDVVRWLHENRDEGCGEILHSLALDGMHLDVMKFLYEHRRDEIGSVIGAIQSWKDVYECPHYWKRNMNRSSTSWVGREYRYTYIDIFQWLREKLKEEILENRNKNKEDETDG